MKKTDSDSLRNWVAKADREDPLRRLLVRLTLAQKRADIQMANSAPPTAPTADRLNRKRFARAQMAKVAREINGSSRPPIDKEILATRYRQNDVLDALLVARRDLWRPVLRRDRSAPPVTVSLPRLSFLDAPEETFRCLADLTRIETSALQVRVDFDFEYVEDIGPFLLMQEFWDSFAPVFTGGTIHPAVQKVLFSVGLTRSLGMHFPALRSLQDVWALPVQRRRPTGRSQSLDRYLEPQTAEIAADRLVDEIDIWLSAAGTDAELTERGRANIKSMVTEMLDNAERHSSYQDRDGSWSLAAFMARRVVGGESRYLCHFAILSTGSTIADSLNATAPPELADKIIGFVDRIQRTGARQTYATLVTLAALQDGVTRDARAYNAGSGGYGFMSFVESVNILGLSNRPELAPKITIISGRSCIRLKDRYIVGVRRDGDGPRQLLFNPSNSTGEQPDSEYVYDLPVHLPGTVICVGFALDPDFYRTTLNGHHRTEGTNEG